MTQPAARAMDDADKSRARAHARMAFLLGLRARGIADVGVLRALEVAPRENFVPRQYADLAWRDIALPIACGQTMPEPWLVARMMEALNVAASHRALEIGSGSGYATAILSQLAGDVVSFERYRSLAVEARTRLEALGFGNARILWDDGLEAGPASGPFDRIVVHGCLDAIPPALTDALSPNGVLVAVRPGGRGRRLVRHVKTLAGFDELDLAACRAGPLAQGRSDFL